MPLTPSQLNTLREKVLQNIQIPLACLTGRHETAAAAVVKALEFMALFVSLDKDTEKQ